MTLQTTDPSTETLPHDAPDWSTRPWGRPTVHPAISGVNPNLVATCDFRYHGIRVRGVRIFKNANDFSVSMPQKKFGDSIEHVVYFMNQGERDQFMKDLLYVYKSVFGRRHRPPTADGVAVAS